MDKLLYSPLSQAVDFFNNLLPGPGLEEDRSIIGDYWRYGYSNKTIFVDYLPDFKVSDFSNRIMGDFWPNMFDNDNMTNSNSTWY